MKQPARRSSHATPSHEEQLGDSLRKVYDQALGEDVPKEMLDLLGKLD